MKILRLLKVSFRLAPGPDRCPVCSRCTCPWREEATPYPDPWQFVCQVEERPSTTEVYFGRLKTVVRVGVSSRSSGGLDVGMGGRDDSRKR